VKLRKMSKILFGVMILSMHTSSIFAKETIPPVIDNSIQINNGSSDGECVLTAVETEELGNITIALEDTKKQLSKDGVKFGIVKIADVYKGKFVLEKIYEDTSINLNEIKNANELELAAKKLEKKSKTPIDYIITNDEGIAKISDLSVGVYLIYAEDIANYENITPFLISVPMFQESEQVMKYDIDVYPKHTPLEIKEKPQIPQTGIDNRAKEYAVMSLCLFVMSFVLFEKLYAKKKSGVDLNL